MKIAVMDGQGAGLGQTLIKKMRQSLPGDWTIIALGTNTAGTAKMVRSGATFGMSGEKAFCAFFRREAIDCIIAPIGILQPGSIHGEITESMTHAFTQLSCKKYILPVHHPKLLIPCTADIPIKQFIDDIITDLKNVCS